MSILFPKTINYKQISGTYVNGVFQKTEIESTFEGDVQPLSGKELISLNIGREDRGKIKIYANASLNIAIEGTNNSGDMIIFDNAEWEIIAKMTHDNDIISHWKYIAEYRKVVT